MVGAIAPWNVPLFIAAAKLAPSLVAGCTVVYKPAPETPVRRLPAGRDLRRRRAAQGRPLRGAGRPRGQRAPGEAPRRRQDLVHRARVSGGKRIGGLCGERLKRCTLELGGKSAAIILDDADLATTIPTLLPNAIMNNGQACIAQTRILAPRVALRRGGRRRRLGRRRHEGGRPDGPGHRGRPGGGRAAAEPDRGVSRQRARGGRHGRARRRPPVRVRLRQGLVRGAHGVLRRRQQNEDRPGGDLRPGPRGHPLRR